MMSRTSVSASGWLESFGGRLVVPEDFVFSCAGGSGTMIDYVVLNEPAFLMPNLLAKKAGTLCSQSAFFNTFEKMWRTTDPFLLKSFAEGVERA